MRRYRRIRTGYRSGTKKKSVKKTVIRVLFVIVCAILLTGVSVLLGYHLKGKAGIAESLLTTEDPDSTESSPTVEVFPDGVPSTSDAAKLKVCAAAVDVLSETPASIKQKLGAMSDKYNAVSVDLVSESGQLIYLSEALLNYVRLDPTKLTSLPIVPSPSDSDDENGDADKTESYALDNIKALIKEASASSLRVGAVYSSTPDVLGDETSSVVKREIDRVILGEIDSLGFDEVIITGLVGDDENISHETLKSIVSYLALLRQSTGDLDIGVMLPSSVYLIPQSASIIKSLSEYVDLLAIAIHTDAETQDEAYSSVYDNCHSLKGNFSVYNIRGVITNTDADISSAVYAALSDLSVSSVQFTSFVESPEYTPEHVSAEDTSEVASGGASNENANRKDDYTDETETDPVTE